MRKPVRTAQGQRVQIGGCRNVDDTVPLEGSCKCGLFDRKKELVRFFLKLLKRDFTAGVRLQMRIELVELLHTDFAGRASRHTGAELLKMDTDSIQGKTAAAVGTLDSAHR